MSVATTIFTSGCNGDGNSLPNENSTICELGTLDLETDLISESVKREMFTVEDLILRDSLISQDSLLAYYFKDSYNRSLIKDALAEDASLLQQLGFDGYVNEKQNQGIWSASMKDTLIGIKSEFENFVNSMAPTLEQTISFWTNKITELSTSALCGGEKQKLGIFFHGAIGVAEYFYHSIGQAIVTTNGIEVRGCNFFQVLLCATLSAVVGVASTAVSFVAALVGLEAIGIAGEVQTFINGVQVPQEVFAAVVAIITGIVATLHFYTWCCSWFNHHIDCRKPENVHAFVTGCNEFRLNAWGAGDDVDSYVWNNQNTDPAFAVTQTSFLDVSVPNPGQPSFIDVYVVCKNATPTDDFKETMTLISGNAPCCLSWAVQPPSSASSGQTVQVVVLANLSGPNVLSWSVTGPASITSTGAYTANVTFGSGYSTVTVTATLTNTCSGLSTSISHFVSVTP